MNRMNIIIYIIYRYHRQCLLVAASSARCLAAVTSSLATGLREELSRGCPGRPGQSQEIRNCSGFIWIYMDLYGFIWIYSGFVWIYNGFIVDLYGFIMDLYGFMWIYMDLWWIYGGSIWIYGGFMVDL